MHRMGAEAVAGARSRLAPPEAGRIHGDAARRRPGRALGERREPAGALRVRATVARRGAQRVLRWAAGPIPRQRLTFVERTAAGQTQTLATTTRRAGQVAFTPLVSRSRTHRIEVLAARTSGTPRAQRVVARFVVAPAARAGRAQRVALGGRALKWRLPGARGFSVSLRYGDGTSLALTTTRAAARLPRALRNNERLTITIVGIDALGRPGPAATAKFGGPKPKAKRAAPR